MDSIFQALESAQQSTKNGSIFDFKTQQGAWVHDEENPDLFYYQPGGVTVARARRYLRRGSTIFSVYLKNDDQYILRGNFTNLEDARNAVDTTDVATYVDEYHKKRNATLTLKRQQKEAAARRASRQIDKSNEAVKAALLKMFYGEVKPMLENKLISRDHIAGFCECFKALRKYLPKEVLPE